LTAAAPASAAARLDEAELPPPLELASRHRHTARSERGQEAASAAVAVRRIRPLLRQRLPAASHLLRAETRGSSSPPSGTLCLARTSGWPRHVRGIEGSGRLLARGKILQTRQAFRPRDNRL
jgi:hypothetical protein